AVEHGILCLGTRHQDGVDRGPGRLLSLLVGHLVEDTSPSHHLVVAGGDVARLQRVGVLGRTSECEAAPGGDSGGHEDGQPQHARTLHRSSVRSSVPRSYCSYASTIDATIRCRTTSLLVSSTNATPSIPERMFRTTLRPDCC